MVIAVAVVMVASLAMVPGPAMADDFDFEEGFFCVSDNDFFDGYDDFDFSFGGDGVNQSFKQESESGDVDQSFDVS